MPNLFSEAFYISLEELQSIQKLFMSPILDFDDFHSKTNETFCLTESRTTVYLIVSEVVDRYFHLMTNICIYRTSPNATQDIDVATQKCLHGVASR